jgi:hypothetical protein
MKKFLTSILILADATKLPNKRRLLKDFYWLTVKSLSEEILPSQPIKIFKFKFFLGNFEAS